MQKIKQLFPNINGLHSRIDTLIRNSSVGKIAIIPKNRAEGKGVLEALVADPLGDSQWFKSLQDRPLTKDILVSQSDAFEFIQTQNSLTVYPVPFKGPSVDILEVDASNWDHIQTADLIVSVGGRSVAGYPCIEVGPNLRVEDALKADEMLRESPKNISQWLDLHSKSGVDNLKRQVLRPVDELRADLKSSVVNTCKQLIDEGNIQQSNDSAITQKVAELRNDWSREAHREMQLMVNTYKTVLGSTLAWYKLYARIDDVDTVLRSVPVLPRSRTSLEYATGSIDSMVHAPSTSKPAVALDVLQSNVNNMSTVLHNKALKLLTLNVLGVQAPISAVAAAGVYFDQFSGYSMAALAALGIVTGASRLQKSWMQLCTAYIADLEQATKGAIQQSETSLWNIYEEKKHNQAQHIARQQEALNDICI